MTFVIPVRYVSGGAVVQTTSSEISAGAIDVRSVQPPRPGLVIGMQLYFPGGDAIPATALVVETIDEGRGFRAEFAGDESGGARLAELLTRHGNASSRSCQRFPTHLRTRVVQEGRSTEGTIVNLSRSGAFVKTDVALPPASIVDLSIAIPGAPGRETAQAFVVHAAERAGIGVQFIGGSDEFRSRVDGYIAALAP